MRCSRAPSRSISPRPPTRRARWRARPISSGSPSSRAVTASSCSATSAIRRSTRRRRRPACSKHAGRDFENVVVFQSLSKRSNLPGLRVGFAAGDKKFLARFLELRNVSSPQVPVPAQRVAIAAYSDEEHVDENRALYAQKFDLADQILGDRYGYKRPAGGFLLWLDVSAHGGDEAVTLQAVEGSRPARHPRQLSRARAGRRLQSRRRLYPRRHRAGSGHHGGGAASPRRGARLRTSHVGNRPRPRHV